MKIKVGTVVKLKVYCLRNPAGTLGVCYETYHLGDREGYGFIFENGEYDGFAPDEVADCLAIVGTCESCEDYEFSNVVRLSMDFEGGRFADALRGEYTKWV